MKSLAARRIGAHLALVLFVALVLVACEGENRPTQVTAPSATSPAAASPAAGTSVPAAGPTATPCPGQAGYVNPATGSVSAGGASVSGGCGAGGPGVVMLKSGDATQVDITLTEWTLVPSVKEIKSGKLYFLAKNNGPERPHEVVIIKSDLAPDQLPYENAKVPEDKVTVIGEIESFAPLSSASGEFTLQAGNYVLICNLRDIVGFEFQSHYREGMYSAFKVTP